MSASHGPRRRAKYALAAQHCSATDKTDCGYRTAGLIPSLLDQRACQPAFRPQPIRADRVRVTESPAFGRRPGCSRSGRTRRPPVRRRRRWSTGGRPERFGYARLCMSGYL